MTTFYCNTPCKREFKVPIFFKSATFKATFTVLFCSGADKKQSGMLQESNKCFFIFENRWSSCMCRIYLVSGAMVQNWIFQMKKSYNLNNSSAYLRKAVLHFGSITNLILKVHLAFLFWTTSNYIELPNNIIFYCIYHKWNFISLVIREDLQTRQKVEETHC